MATRIRQAPRARTLTAGLTVSIVMFPAFASADLANGPGHFSAVPAGGIEIAGKAFANEPSFGARCEGQYWKKATGSTYLGYEEILQPIPLVGGGSATIGEPQPANPIPIIVVIVIIAMVVHEIMEEDPENLEWTYRCLATDVVVSGQCWDGVLRKCAIEADQGSGFQEVRDATCTYDGVLVSGCDPSMNLGDYQVFEKKGEGKRDRAGDACTVPSARVANRAQYDALTILAPDDVSYFPEHCEYGVTIDWTSLL